MSSTSATKQARSERPSPQAVLDPQMTEQDETELVPSLHDLIALLRYSYSQGGSRVAN